MKLIKLTGKYGAIIGNYAQVSDEDYKYLSQWSWRGMISSKTNCKTIYVIRISKQKTIYMHREILQVVDSKILIDHIDSNGLNNQRDNLRIATPSQNQANRKSIGASKYLGVTLFKSRKNIYWRAQCKKDGKIYSKLYKTEQEAAVKYNEMAKMHHGEFAKLNIID